MRRTAALAVTLALATAAVAGAAPRGIVFTDPAGDANGLDGRAEAGSQAAFDVTRVRIAPHAANAKWAGVAVTVELAAAPATSPGSSYYLAATQGACDIRVTRTATVDGVASSTLVTCDGVSGRYSGHDVARGTFATAGRALTFVVPAEALTDPRIGAVLTGIEVGTAAGEPTLGRVAPVTIDRATYPRPYRIGS